MKSEPNFIFGNAYGAFFGKPSQNVFHQNAAFQIVLSQTDEIIIIGENNEKYMGKIA